MSDSDSSAADAAGRPLERGSGSDDLDLDCNGFDQSQRQAQLMKSIGQLAHDFNNLLTPILGHAELGQVSLDSEHPVQRSLEQIMTAAARAQALTDELLAVGRKQVLEMCALDLSDHARRDEAVLRGLIPGNIALEFDLFTELDLVRADPEQLRRVCTTLVANAGVAMPDGGRLTFRTANVQVAPNGRLAALLGEPGRYVMLSVADTGCGLDEATVDRIFEPFLAREQSVSGTGLGLAAVYGVVQQHGGGTRVRSEVGGGSVFEVYLPSLSAPACEVPRRG